MSKYSNIKPRKIVNHTEIYKNAGGRPRKDIEEQKIKKITVCLTQQEFEELVYSSKKQGFSSLSVFVRKFLIDSDIIWYNYILSDKNWFYIIKRRGYE